MSKAQLQAKKWRKEMVTSLSFLNAKHSIHAERLGKRFGISKNYMVKVIAEQILMDGIQIGSSMDGYFTIKSSFDREKAIAWLKQRGFKTILRCAIIAGEHVEDVFMDAWRTYYETRRTKAIERNLFLSARQMTRTEKKAAAK